MNVRYKCYMNIWSTSVSTLTDRDHSSLTQVLQRCGDVNEILCHLKKGGQQFTIKNHVQMVHTFCSVCWSPLKTRKQHICMLPCIYVCMLPKPFTVNYTYTNLYTIAQNQVHTRMRIHFFFSSLSFLFLVCQHIAVNRHKIKHWFTHTHTHTTTTAHTHPPPQHTFYRH